MYVSIRCWREGFPLNISRSNPDDGNVNGDGKRDGKKVNSMEDETIEKFMQNRMATTWRASNDGDEMRITTYR